MVGHMMELSLYYADMTSLLSKTYFRQSTIAACTRVDGIVDIPSPESRRWLKTQAD